MLHWWDTIHDVFIYCRIEILCMMTILCNRRNSRGNLNINQNSVKWIPQYSKIAYKSQCSLHFWESTNLNFIQCTSIHWTVFQSERNGVYRCSPVHLNSYNFPWSEIYCISMPKKVYFITLALSCIAFHYILPMQYHSFSAKVIFGINLFSGRFWGSRIISII